MKRKVTTRRIDAKGRIVLPPRFRGQSVSITEHEGVLIIKIVPKIQRMTLDKLLEESGEQE